MRRVSSIPVAFGGAAISGEGGGYGFGEITERQAIGLLRASYERGIKIFDTAPVYGFSLSEKRLGKAFKDIRDRVFIVSKCGVSWHGSKRINMSNDPQVAKSMLEQSLRDLQSDYIDLYMIHWPDKRVDIRKTMEVLARAKQQKKVLHLGLCNTNLEDLTLASEVEHIEVVQSELNLFNRASVNDLFPFLKEQKISFMSWGTFDKGIITGRVSKQRKFDQSDARSWAPWWKKSNYQEKIEKMQKVFLFLQQQNVSPVSLALAHNLSYPEVSSAICGIRNIEQLDSVFYALENLPEQEIINHALELIDE